MMERWRLFVAAELDDAARAACTAAAGRLRMAGFPGRWVVPDNYHLTVAFLGPVEAERVGAIGAALGDAAGGVPPFTVPLDTVGAFPRRSAARIAWVGPARPVAAFGALAMGVRTALGPLGFSLDPHTDPHVTLARADGRHALPAVHPQPAATLPVRSIVLYRSFTESAGARYLALDRFALR